MKNKRLIPLACQHKYCGPCFEQLVTTAMQDEHLFPPKCCLQDIPAKLVQSHLTAEQKQLYKVKAEEYAVPAGDRWYCPNVYCAKWIDRRTTPVVDGEVSCPHCRRDICAICRGESHPNGTECPQDFGMEAALEEAEFNGWRRCYQCHAMVELATGCRHMTCRCRAEFCYVCGARWRTCQCTEDDKNALLRQVEERRLQNDAEAREVAEAIAAVERAQEEERRQEEEREAQRLADEALAAERREVARVALIKQTFALLRAGLAAVHDAQHAALEARHEEERAKLEDEKRNAVKNCEARHAQELEALEARLEQEEDDYFIGIRAHLRGKPNREAREKAALETVRHVQDEEREALRMAQASQLEKLVKAEAEAAQAVPGAVSGERAELQRRHVAEKQWLNVAVSVREDIVSIDERGIAASGEELGVYEQRVGRVLATEGNRELATAMSAATEMPSEAWPTELSTGQASAPAQELDVGAGATGAGAGAGADEEARKDDAILQRFESMRLAHVRDASLRT